MTNKIRGFEVAKGFENKDINLPVRATEGSAGYDFEAAEDITIPSIFNISTISEVRQIEFMGKAILGKDNIVTQEMFNDALKDMVTSDNDEDQIKAMELMLKLITLFEDKFGLTLEEMIETPDMINNIGNLAMDDIADLIPLDEFEDLMTKIAKDFKPVLVPTGVKAYMQNGEYLQIVNRSSNPLKRFLILSNGIGVVDKDYYSNPDNDGHIMGQFINFSNKPIHIKKGERIFQGIFQSYLVADDDNATGKRVGGHGSTSK